MQRGARFSILLSFWTCLGAPEVGPSGGVETSIKPMLFEGISKLWAIMGILGAAAKSIPKNEIGKICPENECFVRFLGELFGAHLGFSIFWGAHASLRKMAPPDASKSVPAPATATFGRFGGECFGEIHLDYTEKKDQKNVPMQRGARFVFSRSAPMQRGARPASFLVSPERCHAAWRSFCFGRDCSHAAWGSFFLKQLRSHAGLRGILGALTVFR